jgi:ABC-type multidrug transport system fused ATPase/permease subunit
MGATTIRAFDLQDDFIKSSEHKIDCNQKAYYPCIVANLWISLRLEFIGGVVVFASAVFAILGRNSITPGVIGLSVSNALQITQLLTFLVRTVSDLESNAVAVERMMDTTELPQEASWNRKPEPPMGWPSEGKLEFKNYQTRYKEGLELILQNITCSIKPGEKIGIIGRTGAGKSSMTLALFRIVEPAGGSILIDGLDVTSLGLHNLRSKITIIPQDPVLFSGTLRSNLDPFKRHTDDQLWSCLELAHLKTYVRGLPEGLDHIMAEEGRNFSTGQRQLVCLARALLRKTKILVLDEATAAVDFETDDLIQKTIRNEFKDSTVVTIAHRLHTILDSTRVLVLDKGEIKEFDTPDALLKNTESLFFKMAKDDGIR